MTVKMLVVQGRPTGKTLVFPDGVYYIGRGTECHIRPNSEWVSRQHCLLRVAGHVVTIRDLGSRNGTLVNGVLLEREQMLDSGDQIQVGPLVFELRLDESSSTRSASHAVPGGPTNPIASDGTRPEGEDERVNDQRSTENYPALPPET
jgi:pSer/pThr/pTyr-binding forkhead associated (FHA) protein